MKNRMFKSDYHHALCEVKRKTFYGMESNYGVEKKYDKELVELAKRITYKDDDETPNTIVVRADSEQTKILLDGLFANLINHSLLVKMAYDLALFGQVTQFIEYTRYGAGLLWEIPSNEIYFFDEKNPFFSLNHTTTFWNGPGIYLEPTWYISIINKFLGEDSVYNAGPYGHSIRLGRKDLLSHRIAIRSAIERALEILARFHLDQLNFQHRKPDKPFTFDVYIDTPMIEVNCTREQPTMGAIRNFDGSELNLSASDGPRDYVIDETDLLDDKTKRKNALVLMHELGLVSTEGK